MEKESEYKVSYNEVTKKGIMKTSRKFSKLSEARIFGNDKRTRGDLSL